MDSTRLQRRATADLPSDPQVLRERVDMLLTLNTELERKLQQHVLQLEQAREDLKVSHEELGAFSYSVSHDLRSPLAAVQGYIQFYLEDYGANVSPAGKELLGEAVAGAVRMGRLIEDLQSYSRFSRQPLEKHIIDLRPLVEHVVQVLTEQDDPQRRVHVRVEDLGDVPCDPALMEQVFMQLLGNALKFTRGKDPAEISVRRLTQEKGFVFQVSDNGAGFDMQYAHKLFGVFQRLHSAGQFEGRGIGLSIAQRIIQRHGGRIWANAAPGQGATFFFSLPNLPI